jgi:peptidase M48-like protein/PDZ domain-containing protein
MSLRLLLPLICALSAIAASLPGNPATTLRPEDLRVASVGYRLAVQGAAYCPEPFPLTGLLLHHLPEYDEQGRVLEIARHGLDRGPGVLATVADSPAARAGILAGDVLLGVNGTGFPDPRLMVTDRRSKDWRAPVEATEAQLESALRRGPAELRIWRAGQVLDLQLQPLQGCPARVRLARSNQANAFATGTYVVVTTRILDALRSDDELAIIIGHELAHNILHHKQRLEGEQGASGSSDSKPLRTRASEEEADRLGLRLAAAAGYDLNAAIPMWRRLYAQFGGGLPVFRGHPGLNARERIIEEVIAQLEKEKSQGAQSVSH